MKSTAKPLLLHWEPVTHCRPFDFETAGKRAKLSGHVVQEFSFSQEAQDVEQAVITTQRLMATVRKSEAD